MYSTKLQPTNSNMNRFLSFFHSISMYVNWAICSCVALTNTNRLLSLSSIQMQQNNFWGERACRHIQKMPLKRNFFYILHKLLSYVYAFHTVIQLTSAPSVVWWWACIPYNIAQLIGLFILSKCHLSYPNHSTRGSIFISFVGMQPLNSN